MEACTETSPNEKAMLLPRSYFPKFSKPFEEFIYPKGDPDAVSIGKRDVDLLRPDTFVNDTIIDFYIKYLKNKQKPEESCRFQFFNSFFFQKMANMDKDPSSAFDGKAAFQRVCKWTRKVNLLEKDFIFIPVNYNYHWSVIVICYFGEVVKYEDADKSDRVPCILHMDSIRGSHAGLHDLMRSYLWEEWKERQKEACEDLHTKFRNLKFVLLELPQQQNSYDCGLFLLHYVELFLEEVPVNFSIYNITSSSKFEEVETSMHFAYTTSTSTAFQHPDGIRPETSIFPYPSTDFKLESSVHQDAFEDTNTSPATSIYDSDDTSEVEVVKKCQAIGEISFDDKLDKPRCTSAENINCLAGCLASVPGQMQYAGESRTPVQASDHNYGAYPIITFQKSLPEFYHEENELLSYGGIHHKCLNDCPNPVSGEMLEVPDSECPTRMLEPDDNADLLESTSALYCQRNYMQQDGIESVSELDCPKRMRLTTSSCKERT